MPKASFMVIAMLVSYLVSAGFSASYVNVTASEAYTMLETHSSLVVLDVRTLSEYDSGHIKSAKLIPHTELGGRLDELNSTDEILVYCGSGGRSATASQILVDNGFLYVYNLLGGILAWKAAGYAVYVKYSSIQEAINNADEGATIHVSSGIYYENVVVNRTVSLFGEDRETTIIDGGGIGNVVHVTSNSTLLQSFTLQNGQFGIVFNHSYWSEFVLNHVYSCYEYGIFLRYSNNNIISSNIISYNSWSGIWIGGSSLNVISDNSVTNSHIGIRFIGPSHYNLVEMNYVSNNDEGIHLNSNHNIVNGNVAKNNSIGISLWAWYNNITGNSLSDEGVRIEDSNYNRVYHNNFHNVNIAWHGIVHHDNFWDNGCEGNYWNNYSGSDSNEDGIGDTPYAINEYNQDNYPLMSLYWNPSDINHDLKVDIRDIATAALAYGSRHDDSNWNPHADIAGPIPLKPDGQVDIRDLALIAKHFGEEYT